MPFYGSVCVDIAVQQADRAVFQRIRGEENEASVDTAIGRALVGVNSPTFLVLPVVVQRCSYCISANYPVSCCAADPPHLTPRALSAIFSVSSCPLLLSSSVLPFIMLTTTLVVNLDSVQRPLSVKLGCKGVNQLLTTTIVVTL